MPAPKGNKNAAGRRFRSAETTPWPVRAAPHLATAGRTHGGITVRKELRDLPEHARPTGRRSPRPLREMTRPDLDPGSVVAVVFDAVRDELLGSLAGADNLSAQELWLVDEATALRLQLMYLNTWLARQPELVNGKTKQLLPVLTQQQGLLKSLTRILDMLGLKRRARDVGTLRDYLAGHAAEDGPAEPAEAPQ